MDSMQLRPVSDSGEAITLIGPTGTSPRITEGNTIGTNALL